MCHTEQFIVTRFFNSYFWGEYICSWTVPELIELLNPKDYKMTAKTLPGRDYKSDFLQRVLSVEGPGLFLLRSIPTRFCTEFTPEWPILKRKRIYSFLDSCKCAFLSFRDAIIEQAFWFIKISLFCHLRYMLKIGCTKWNKVCFCFHINVWVAVLDKKTILSYFHKSYKTVHGFGVEQ